MSAGRPEKGGDTGQAAPLATYAVGHTAFTAVDLARGDRALLVDVWYPSAEDPEAATPTTAYPLGPGIDLPSELAVEGAAVAGGGPHPLLVFSHGYQGIHTQSVELMEALAQRGFVVAAPEHTGNTQSDPSDPFDVAAAHRVPDVSFVIDAMSARSADEDDPLVGSVDQDRVGVLGHTFGGMTALGMVAGWAGAEPDPRVMAALPISAVIDGDLQRDDRDGPNAGFGPAVLAEVTRPVLLMGGTADTSVPIENNALAFDWLTGVPLVYQVDIIGANHTHFANVCAIGALLIDMGISTDMWAALGAEDLLDPYADTCTGDALDMDEAIRAQLRALGYAN